MVTSQKDQTSKSKNHQLFFFGDEINLISFKVTWEMRKKASCVIAEFIFYSSNLLPERKTCSLFLMISSSFAQTENRRTSWRSVHALACSRVWLAALLTQTYAFRRWSWMCRWATERLGVYSHLLCYTDPDVEEPRLHKCASVFPLKRLRDGCSRPSGSSFIALSGHVFKGQFLRVHFFPPNHKVTNSWWEEAFILKCVWGCSWRLICKLFPGVIDFWFNLKISEHLVLFNQKLKIFKFGAKTEKDLHV